jgi:hypothetical protein
MPTSQPTLNDLQKSTPELMCFSIVELLFLLKLARYERSFIYKQRHTFIQALKQGENQFNEGEQYTFKEYEFYTRKCFVLENLYSGAYWVYSGKVNRIIYSKSCCQNGGIDQKRYGHPAT